jgi:ATP-dependent DNA helicase DinG
MIGLMPAESSSSRDWRSLPALVPAPGGAVVCWPDGACSSAGLEEARKLFRSGEVLVAHTAFISGRLKSPPAAALFDVLELFAFVRPGAPCVPSALGLARALGAPPPQSQDDCARSLREAAQTLIAMIGDAPEGSRTNMRALAGSLQRAGWRWSPAILEVLGEAEAKPSPLAGLESWRS